MMNCTEMEMLTNLLGLEALVKENHNPKVYHMLEELSSRLYKNYPLLYMVGSQDLKELLPPPYYHRLESCVYKIADYIAGCQKGAHKGNPPPVPADAFKELEKLLKTICMIKEHEQLDLAALEAISPPLSDAKAYLDEDEHLSFLKSLSVAIDAYLDQNAVEKLYCPELWKEYSQQYTSWLSIIQSRKEKAANSKRAQAEYEQYKASINHLISMVKSLLTTEKPPQFIYPKTIKPYAPDQWCELKLPVKQEVQGWVKTKIKEIVPVEVSDFIKWNISYQIIALPSAKYEMLGIPCLTWIFTVRLLVTLHLYVTGEAVYKNFRGISYPVNMPNEELGYYHLGPVEWDTLEGFSTPITLLAMLSKDKIEHDGIKIIAHDSPFTVYEVEGYDEDSVEIHDLFLKFIVDITKGKSLSQGLLAAGVVDKMTASLIESKALVPLSKKESIQVELEKNTDNNNAVIQALEALGYKKSEAIKMVDKAQLCEGMSLEEKVQAVLKSLGDSN